MNYPIKSVKGFRFYYRPGTSDEKAIQENIVEECYKHRFKSDKKIFDISPNEKWLDLGAYIGTFHVWASKKGAEVISYEPDSESFFLLSKNLTLNGLEGVLINKAVVGSGEKELSLFIGKNGNYWRNSVIKIKSDKFLKVSCVNFNEILTDDITGIKMDIEGSEFQILDNIKSWRNVRKLVFEYSFDIEKSIPLFFEYIKKLQKHFSIVHHRKFIPGEIEYKHFPPATTVFCWNE